MATTRSPNHDISARFPELVCRLSSAQPSQDHHDHRQFKRKSEGQQQSQHKRNVVAQLHKVA